MTDADHKNPQEQLISIQVAKDYLGFSAGHFTIFSATRRERLHGHSFRLQVEVLAPVDDNGLTFDYVPLKQMLKRLCDELDERLLLPGRSPHLKISQEAGLVKAFFDQDVLSFPENDVLILPIRNITVEELSHYFLERVLALFDVATLDIRKLMVAVSSGVGQWGRCRWSAS